MPVVHGAMICGRLDEPFLAVALDSVADLCDLVVVQDNGMTDENLARLRSSLLYPDRIRLVMAPWVSFSHNRNLAIDVAEREGAHWVLRLDADEVHRRPMAAFLKRELDELARIAPDADGIEVTMWHHMITPYHVQGAHPLIALHRAHVRYSGDVHEGPGCHRVAKELWYEMHHYGYCRPPERVLQSWELYEQIGGARQAGYSHAVQYEISQCNGDTSRLLALRKPLATSCPREVPAEMASFIEQHGLRERYLAQWEAL